MKTFFSFLLAVLRRPLRYARMWWRHGINPWTHWQRLEGFKVAARGWFSPMHLLRNNRTAVCGEDDPDAWYTEDREFVSCPCCLGEHYWQWVKTPSTPNGHGEWIKACKDCARECPGSDGE